MPKNLLRICYESTANFFIREFGTKILNSSKLLSRTPEHSRITRIVNGQGANQLRTPRITYETTTNPCISGFLAIRGIHGHSVIGVLPTLSSSRNFSIIARFPVLLQTTQDQSRNVTEISLLRTYDTHP